MNQWLIRALCHTATAVPQGRPASMHGIDNAPPIRWSMESKLAAIQPWPRRGAHELMVRADSEVVEPAWFCKLVLHITSW